MTPLMNRVILLLLLLLDTACSVANVTSNKDPNYNANIYNLAVTEAGPTIDFQDSFNKNLPQLFMPCGVISTFKSSLKDGQAEATNKRFDAVLNITLEYIVQPTNWGVPSGYPSNFHYVLTLYDPAGNKIWKALMDYHGGLVMGSERRGLVFASEVVKQMNEDGIVSGCMPKD